MNAPVMGRNDYLRRLEMWFFGSVACEFAASYKWLHGVGSQGFMMHYTAPKLISHEFVTRERIDSAHCFAIVRNPYSRMFSIYKYNRYGNLEGFEHFVKEWYQKWKRYKKKGSTEEWDAYCHVLQMKEFTHDEDGNQIIPYIIRQEDLNELTKKGGATDKNIQVRYSNLPDIVLEALRGMPHSNSRSSKKHWSQYYNQTTMDLVYEMYRPDFKEFSYSTSIPKRENLTPKDSYRPTFCEFQASSRRIVDKSLFDLPVDLEENKEYSSVAIIGKANEELGKRKLQETEVPDEKKHVDTEKIEVVVANHEINSKAKAEEGVREPDKVETKSETNDVETSELALKESNKEATEFPKTDTKEQN
eukprot:CAMPEP_0204823742 /NCGR_PEP_ID=MMETSP1346-20131115/1818_1 /ASSEMBLY_ACC=CAM_ASM_000771 /TAXON_ID=215587 /ORGANISM="Aplanochytrium stocchinoi, Strain GSBS06" /LENGTH=359 /DNA_ID=CAMNT_0051950523 /DNA_START=591 /DNA_END=1670 /DNA_ORIENTATION=+